ncbi:metal-dependent hydrolase [Desulfobaculum senezii]
MDPVTHITSGALMARAFRGTFPGRLAAFFIILAAWIPDIDNFVGLSPEQYLLYHRGITHSVFGAVVQALVLAGVWKLFRRDVSAMRALAAMYGAIMLHIFLDLITSYGTQLLAPLSDTRFEIAGVFIIDPFYTLTMLALLVASIRSRNCARRLGVIGLAFVIVYPLCCIGVKNTVQTMVPSLLRQHDVAYESATVTTDPFSPVYWKLIVDDGERIRVASICVLTAAEDDLHFTNFEKADRSVLARLGEKVSMFRTWNWFAAWPVVARSTRSPEQVLTFTDARFYSNNPVLRRLIGERDAPFALEAVLAPDGTLLEYTYDSPGNGKDEPHTP